MKKTIKSMVVRVFAVMFILCTYMTSTVWGSFKRETISLDMNQVWNYRETVTRTLKYSYGVARCYSVYPPNGGADGYTRIQAAIMLNGKRISDVCILYETAADTTPIKIYEGYLNNTEIQFAFRGNDPALAARADVYYAGK